MSAWSARAAAAVLACTIVSPAAATDVAGLPDYAPQRIVSGTIRCSGNAHMARLLKRWEAGFRTYHRDVRFAESLHGTASGIYGLEMRTADVALMGRAINPFERYGTYERSWTYPVEIEVATGSASRAGDSPALAVFVNAHNPLAKLTLVQLDGVFGAQRGGGWNALSWITAAARPAAENLRRWDQLGVRGPLAHAPIHVYGPPLLGPGTVTFFQARVLHGGAMWNEDLREFPDARSMLAALRRDPAGIAYGPPDARAPGVKMLALAASARGPFVAITPRSVAARAYPLARPVYLDYTIDNERSEIASPRVAPNVREFLRYILSRQGQAQVTRDGAYLALPAAIVARERRLLDATGVPPEKLLLGE